MSLPIYQRVAVTDAGDVIPGAEYTVINENTGVAAPIYSDRTGATLLSPPYFADSVGTIQFFIAQGTTFRVAASGGVGTYTDRYVYGVAGAVLALADGSATINRLSTDGVLLDLKKDGTTVGFIGVLASRLSIGTGDTGLFFNDQADQIQPFNTSTNSARDAAVDLGGNDRRFKDLYLSGGVVFPAAGTAGTSQSNTLDSYEEGIWTPRYVGSGVAGSSPTGVGTYTKVGRMVTVTANFGNFNATGATGDMRISGLPFTPSSASNNLHTGAAATNGLGADILVSSILVNEGYIRLRIANTTIFKSVVNANNRYLYTTVTYETA